ncbi:unnamed protein product, partial [Ectocarpus sp. 12 AP-2014]
MISPRPTDDQGGGGVPALRVVEGGNPGIHNVADGTASMRSTGSARSRVPLSARSAASAISMHINSYSYLSNRVYDFQQAKSRWLHRVQSERDGDADEGGDAVLKRLPPDFEPFFALDARTRRGKTSSSRSASTSLDAAEGGIRSRAKYLAFQGCFAVFSSRH